MPRLAVVLLTLLCASASLAQSGPYSTREQALEALSAPEAAQRAEAVTWIANHGMQADAETLARRLTDESPMVREFAEQVQARRLKEAIATYSEVIRRKPAFAEGWNRRATVRFLVGDYRKSLADCDEVMKRNPIHFGALAGYGQIYFALERYDQAIEYWRRALEVNPNLVGVEANIKAAEELLDEKRKRMI